jgi:hypothetical protein
VGTEASPATAEADGRRAPPPPLPERPERSA